MTSEIETKRKELEDKLNILDEDGKGSYCNRTHPDWCEFCEVKNNLEGFNLGVKLAQKEFLELLSVHIGNPEMFLKVRKEVQHEKKLCFSKNLLCRSFCRIFKKQKRT